MASSDNASREQFYQAAGYSLMLAPPCLLIISAVIGPTWLAALALIVVAPFLRTIFGDAGEAPVWREDYAMFLERLPLYAVVLHACALVSVLWACEQHVEAGGLVGLGLSLWATLLFGACVGHELTHHRAQAVRVIGRVFTGMIGYPFLEYEHRAHHAAGGCASAAEWPRASESLWGYTMRRCLHIASAAWAGHRHVVAARGAGPALVGLPLATATTGATILAFYVAGGWSGVALYVAAQVGLGWSLQAITYIQHWGLGSDAFEQPSGGHAWEDLCQFQAWLTLGISYHAAHHSKPTLPYYRLQANRGAPRQPAGYVILLFASMVPPVWRALMTPALERWKADPCRQRGAGRKLMCIS